jgi:hypothetical protein
MESILEHFRACDRDIAAGRSLAPERANLFTLMLAFSDASLSIELHRSHTVPDGLGWDVWKPELETTGWQQKPKIDLLPAGA